MPIHEVSNKPTSPSEEEGQDFLQDLSGSFAGMLRERRNIFYVMLMKESRGLLKTV